ncbi:MAG: MBL fold metallo-hydrolase [Deltaproteobacteria bacterium]|nr:MBL fold metallo-hydrolase [Deltaproteobacteria bacterium]
MEKMIWAILILLAIVISVLGYRHYLSITLTSGDKVLASPNFVGNKFVNSVPNKKYTFKEIVGMIFKKGQKDRKPYNPLPVVKLEKSEFGNPPAEKLQFVWLGHSSVLLEFEGKRFLFDPVFAERAGPMLSGPKRFHPIPIKVADLQALDSVIISHDHYDHLDKNVILHLAKQGLSFYVPLGVDRHLIKWGIDKSKILAFDWWDEAQIGDIKIVSTPARHFSGRILLDKDFTFWCSWVLHGRVSRVYFSGDSGMFPGFAEIGERYGPFDLSFMKIGAYGEEWPDIHLTPEEAVTAQAHIRGKLFVPVHWGTFNLAHHSWYEPADRMVEAAAAAKIEIVTPRIGEIVNLSDHQNSFWWQELK